MLHHIYIAYIEYGIPYFACCIYCVLHMLYNSLQLGKPVALYDRVNSIFQESNVEATQMV